MMKTSDKGFDLIKQSEGLKLKAYKCPAGVWTIGYGHTGKDVFPGQKITEIYASELLRKDVVWAENAINKHSLNLNQNQFDALVSFVYNIGAGAFDDSTLLKKAKVNVNDKSIAAEFAKWNKSNGKVLPGLVTRRKAEAELYFSK